MNLYDIDNKVSVAKNAHASMIKSIHQKLQLDYENNDKKGKLYLS